MTARHLLPTPGPAAGIAATFAALVPQLATERTRLRAPGLGDFEAFRQVVGTERGRYVGGPMNDEDTWSAFISMSSGWLLHGHGGWAVEDGDADLLGFVILGLEPGDQDVELGFLFTEAAEGKGFAFEAASVARDWAFRELCLKTLDSYIDAANARSIALAERLGATDETPAGWAGSGARLFRHRNPEAKS